MERDRRVFLWRRGISIRRRQIMSLRITAIWALRVCRRRMPRRHVQVDAVHTPDLPSDILHRIFLYLSLRDIIRCRLVRLDWIHAIAQPAFIDDCRSNYYTSPLVGLFSDRHFHYIGAGDMGLAFDLHPLCDGHIPLYCQVIDSRFGCVLLKHRWGFDHDFRFTYYIPSRSYRRHIILARELVRPPNIYFTTLLPGEPPHHDFRLLVLMRRYPDDFRLLTYDSVSGIWTCTHIRHTVHVPDGFFYHHLVLVDGRLYGCYGMRVLALDVAASRIGMIGDPPIAIPESPRLFSLARTECGRLCFVRLFCLGELSIHVSVVTFDERGAAIWSEVHVTDLSIQLDSAVLDQITVPAVPDDDMLPAAYRVIILGFGERSGMIILRLEDYSGCSVYTFHLTTGRLERRTRFEDEVIHHCVTPYEMDFPTLHTDVS